MAASFEQLLDENLSTVIMKQGSLVTGIVIHGIGSKGILNSAEIDSYGDHRIAMASAIGSLRSDNEVRISDCKNVKTSFPNFIDICKSVGIEINEYE